MGSKGRIPHPYLRHPFPDPGMVHPDPYGPIARPLPGSFPPFDILPPPEVMEHKLATQHVEMQRLATENQRLAATHGTLRRELAGAQHELQILQTHIGAIKSEKEQQMRDLVDKIAKMEDQLKAAEPVRSELQQARADAEKIFEVRRQLKSKVDQLTQDLDRAHANAQQLPALMSELEHLRQEYQRCRISYDHEKKLFSDHLESLQGMEKNYIAMAREVEKLRAELTNMANIDMRGGPYGGTTEKNENVATGRQVGQYMYEDGYSFPQGQGHALLLANSSGGAAINAVGSTGASCIGAQSGRVPLKPGYDAPQGPGYDAARGHGYDAFRGPAYDAQRGHNYDAQRIPGYDMQRVPNYDTQRGPGYDSQRLHGYDAQRGPNYDASRGSSYDAASRGTAVPRVQVAPPNNSPYGSATPPARASGYEAPARGGNPVRR